MNYSEEAKMEEATMRLIITRSKIELLELGLERIDNETSRYIKESVMGITQDLYNIHEILTQKS